MQERGRPKKPKAERRQKQLHILLTEAEHQMVEEKAKSESLGASTWARSIILGVIKGGKVGG